MPNIKQDNAGFSMMEVLVALIVLGVGIWGLVTLFHRNAETIHELEIECRSAFIARSLAAYFHRAGLPDPTSELQPVNTHVGIGPCHSYQWSLRVSETQEEVSSLQIVVFYRNKISGVYSFRAVESG